MPKIQKNKLFIALTTCLLLVSCVKPTFKSQRSNPTLTGSVENAKSPNFSGVDKKKARVDFSKYAYATGRVFSAYDDPAIWQLVKLALPNQRLLERIEKDIGITHEPEVRGGKLLLWNACTRLCDDYFDNTIVINQSPQGQYATVCVYEDKTMNKGLSKWYERGKLIRKTHGGCPNNLSQLDKVR